MNWPISCFSDIPQQNLPNYFGHASGLQTNLAKSSVSPIHCSENNLLFNSEMLSCPVKEFPCTYLGFPLSLGKPTKTEFLPLIDEVDHLPGWKESLMNQAGRLIMVQTLLTATPVYVMTALDLPKWVIKQLTRKFFFLGKVKNKPMGAIVLCLSKGFRCLWNLVVRVYIILRASVGHCVFGGFGLKKRPNKTLGWTANSSSKNCTGSVLRSCGVFSWQWRIYSFLVG